MRRNRDKIKARHGAKIRVGLRRRHVWTVSSSEVRIKPFKGYEMSQVRPAPSRRHWLLRRGILSAFSIAKICGGYPAQTSPAKRMKQQVSQLLTRLRDAGYVADRPLATALVMLESLGRPLLLEGDAGVGKTEVAKALSRVFGSTLIRLQCYEGLDINSAVYEWNYQHQLLTIKLQEQAELSVERQEAEIFSERFLLERPLLKAITQERPPVLLIDEIDRADEEFEAYLLEMLSDFQISIPELGTISARSVPYVLLTSNGTRELSDALRRRCLYHYVDYPSLAKELAILEQQLPHIDRTLAQQIVRFVHALRGKELRKKPGVAETLDWAASLMRLSVERLEADPDLLVDTLPCLLKTRDDTVAISRPAVDAILAGNPA